jgi:hypothetical protein
VTSVLIIANKIRHVFYVCSKCALFSFGNTENVITLHYDQESFAK